MLCQLTSYEVVSCLLQTVRSNSFSPKWCSECHMLKLDLAESTTHSRCTLFPAMNRRHMWPQRMLIHKIFPTLITWIIRLSTTGMRQFMTLHVVSSYKTLLAAPAWIQLLSGMYLFVTIQMGNSFATYRTFFWLSWLVMMWMPGDIFTVWFRRTFTCIPFNRIATIRFRSTFICTTFAACYRIKQKPMASVSTRCLDTSSQPVFKTWHLSRTQLLHHVSKNNRQNCFFLITLLNFYQLW